MSRYNLSVLVTLVLSGCFVTDAELTMALDRDGDGFLPVQAGGDDCDEQRSDVNPAAAEVCGDGVDNDCDGVPDDRGVGEREWYLDEDGDNVGVAETIFACTRPEGYAPVPGDCDDSNTEFRPGANDEDCDGLDQDCDGIPDDEIPLLVRYRDADGDGFGTAEETVEACLEVPGFVIVAGDCDDSDSSISPAAEDFCDGVDQDCDGVEDDDAIFVPIFVDADGDGFGVTGPGVTACDLPAGFSNQQGDCDNQDGSINPLAADLCDGIDQDCDGVPDDDSPVISYFQDLDGDGAGNGMVGVDSCGVVPGFSTVSGDCDDTNASISPLLDDICDGIDNDCDLTVDEDSVRTVFYEDLDGDGVGGASTTEACVAPAGFVPLAGDCDDSDAAIQPGIADAVCDGVDADCDGLLDEDAEFRIWFRDADGDGAGDVGQFESTCDGPPAGFVASALDCDDSDASLILRTWFPDGDGDGFGMGEPVAACDGPQDHTLEEGDCDDSDPERFPTNTELCVNGTDDDCDPMTDCRWPAMLTFETDADLVVPLPTNVVEMTAVMDTVGGPDDDWIVHYANGDLGVVAGGSSPDLASPVSVVAGCGSFEVSDLSGDGKGDLVCSGPLLGVFEGGVAGFSTGPEMVHGLQFPQVDLTNPFGPGIWGRRAGGVFFKSYETGIFGDGFFGGGDADYETSIAVDDSFFVADCGSSSDFSCIAVQATTPTVYRSLGSSDYFGFMTFPSSTIGGTVRVDSHPDFNGDGWRDYSREGLEPTGIIRRRYFLGPVGPNGVEFDPTGYVGQFPLSAESAGDFDGDGFEDWWVPLASEGRIHYGNGEASPLQDVLVNASGAMVAPGDWNADGYSDILKLDSTVGMVQVIFGRGI